MNPYVNLVICHFGSFPVLGGQWSRAHTRVGCLFVRHMECGWRESTGGDLELFGTWSVAGDLEKQ